MDLSNGISLPDSTPFTYMTSCNLTPTCFEKKLKLKLLVRAVWSHAQLAGSVRVLPPSEDAHFLPDLDLLILGVRGCSGEPFDMKSNRY